MSQNQPSKSKPLIIDDFISDQDLLDAPTRDAQSDLGHPDNFWLSGYRWHPWHPNRSPSTPRLRLIEHIWKSAPPVDLSHLKPVGIEHWTGIFSRKETVGDEKGFALAHHVDKDEKHWETTGEVVHPSLGCVYYPIDHECEGGYLKIYHEASASSYEMIAPRFNRLVVFDTSLVHAVTEVTSGRRFAFAMNIWEHTPETFKSQ